MPAELVVPVLLEGFFQLVFEDDDPAGGFEGRAVVDHLPGSCGQAQLVAGVAAVSAGGAERDDQLCLVEAAQEVLRGAHDLRGAAHGVGGVVVVVEHVVGLGHAYLSMTRAPAKDSPGPRVTG